MDFESRFGQQIQTCEQATGHTFSDKRLAAESMNNGGNSASLYTENGQYKQLPKNDRLAVYGDGIAAVALCREWYLGKSSKAGWTLIRNEALSNSRLAERGFCAGLGSCINKDAGTFRVSVKMMATAVEAILGAVHLDGGDDALCRALNQLRIVNPHQPLVLFAGTFKPQSAGQPSSVTGFIPRPWRVPVGKQNVTAGGLDALRSAAVL